VSESNPSLLNSRLAFSPTNKEKLSAVSLFRRWLNVLKMRTNYFEKKTVPSNPGSPNLRHESKWMLKSY
jgi:protein involved in temperature-dependent protein secretion